MAIATSLKKAISAELTRPSTEIPCEGLNGLDFVIITHARRRGGENLFQWRAFIKFRVGGHAYFAGVEFGIQVAVRTSRTFSISTSLMLVSAAVAL